MRVVVAEDSFLMRAGVVRVLEETGFTVVGEASDADELLAQVREHRPDVVVTDIRMPPTNTDEGVRAAAAIRAELPDTGSARPLAARPPGLRRPTARRRTPPGVGYLLKQRVMEPRSFAEAVRQVARGGSALDPEVVAQILERRRPGGPSTISPSASGRCWRGWPKARRNRTIAAELELSDATLERVQARIFEKLELPSDVEGHRRVLAVLTYLRAQED